MANLLANDKSIITKDVMKVVKDGDLVIVQRYHKSDGKQRSQIVRVEYILSDISSRNPSTSVEVGIVLLFFQLNYRKLRE